MQKCTYLDVLTNMLNGVMNIKCILNVLNRNLLIKFQKTEMHNIKLH